MVYVHVANVNVNLVLAAKDVIQTNAMEMNAMVMDHVPMVNVFVTQALPANNATKSKDVRWVALATVNVNMEDVTVNQHG